MGSQKKKQKDSVRLIKKVDKLYKQEKKATDAYINEFSKPSYIDKRKRVKPTRLDNIRYKSEKLVNDYVKKYGKQSVYELADKSKGIGHIVGMDRLLREARSDYLNGK